MKNFMLILIAVLAMFGSCKSTNKTSAVQEKLKLDAETRLKELIDRQQVILADTDDGVNSSITYNNSTNQNTTNIVTSSANADADKEGTNKETTNQADISKTNNSSSNTESNDIKSSTDTDGDKGNNNKENSNKKDINKSTASSNNSESNIKYNNQANSPSNNNESNVKYTKDDVLNDDLFKESESYRDMSERALNAQSYQVALDKANDGHVVLDKYLASRAIRRATETYKEAEKAGLTTSNPDQMAAAVTLIDDASIGVDRKEYVLALNNAEQAQSLLDGLLRDRKGSADKYTVVSGDCLWRIAKKPQIYNDSHAWPKIYMANKQKFKQPDNPHLIFPDQVFDIPRK